MKIGERLQRLRWERNWTQVQLAARAGVSYKHIVVVYSTKGCNDCFHALRYAKALDISLSELLKGVDR